MGVALLTFELTAVRYRVSGRASPDVFQGGIYFHMKSSHSLTRSFKQTRVRSERRDSVILHV